MRWYNKLPFFIRLLHWEYWPFGIVYFPIFFYWLWLSLKSRSFFFFNAANPGIKNGGFLMESKYEIYKLIPQLYYPRTILIPAGTAYNDVLQHIKNENFSYPIIVKPDIGLKGRRVQKVYISTQLQQYVQTCRVDYLLQEYISYENEAGVFYCRFPDEDKGFISGIVLKEFLSVTGDGTSTIKDLILESERSILQFDILRKEYKDELNQVLPEGETRLLVPYGNHIRGAKFTNGAALIDEPLTETIDAVCKQINGFHFGRLDIRYSSWDELKKGRFSIIELNGAGSEPTHIYDPKHSLTFAWKEIARHLKILYWISKVNHQISGIPYMSFTAGVKLFRQHFTHLRNLG